MIDYGLDFELLLYHYDRWLFKTVSGAINTAKRQHCSPAIALDQKAFSAGFWQWQHRFLLDAVRQYGLPSLFVTISPYEWTFPFSSWISMLRPATGRGPTQIPTFETVHIAHVLEQIVRGYLCGSNTNRWRTHVFGYDHERRCNNVLTYFYRFEFQQRGTVHLHLLVWVRDLNLVRFDLFNATIPWDVPGDAFQIVELQCAHQASSLPVQIRPTHVANRNTGPVLAMQHFADDSQRGVRAHLTTLLGALRCQTDIQTSDGGGMLLRYVSSYVAKCHDVSTSEALHSHQLTGFQAACSFLRTIHPLEPEMVFALSSIKPAWTNLRTKRLAVPTPETINSNKEHNQYLRRRATEQHLNFLEWLRLYNTNGVIAKPYATAGTLVGVQLFSMFKPVYFFQYLVCYWPHQRNEDLYHARRDALPPPVEHFAQAVEKLPHIWNSQDAIRAVLEPEGHKAHFVTTVLSYVQSLHDILRLWRVRLVDRTLDYPVARVTSQLYPLSVQQTAIFHVLCQELRSRREHYIRERRRPIQPTYQSSHWTSFHTLLGKPGTGKSQVLVRFIDFLVNSQCHVLVATPIALLANRYQALFSNNVTCETIHAAFRVPVTTSQQHTVNYALSSYDAIVIDEPSMISSTTFGYIVGTLNKLQVRPLVIIAGDERQQQPLECSRGTIRQVESMLHNPEFNQVASKFRLTRQFRCVDPQYLEFLDHIRYWEPSQALLDRVQRGRVVCDRDILRENDLRTILSDHPDATVMTVSREAAAYVNTVVISRLFVHSAALSAIPCDSDLRSFLVYNSMRVFITQNRDKETGVVNGQQGTVIGCQGNTILLRLRDQSVVFIYPVTYPDSTGRNITSYPLVPAYAVTICKSQGATVDTLLLWLDCDTVPRGMAYVGLSRVRRRDDLYLLQSIRCHQVRPAELV